MNLKYILTISVIISVLFISGCKSCPKSCDDSNICTEDFCSKETDYICKHNDIVPCNGNGICEKGELGSSTDCPNCDDLDDCTEDSYDYENQACINKPIIKPENYEGPAGFSRFFGENLIKNNMKVITCFFEEGVSPEEYVNLEKDFSKFSFACSSVTPQNKVGCQVGDEDFNRHFVNLYMRNYGDLWKIAKIEDPDNSLK